MMAHSSARSSLRSLLLISFVILSCGFLGTAFGQKTGADSDPSNPSELNDSLRGFVQVYSIVEQNYAVPVDADKAIYSCAIAGMLRVLDPHSNFFDPKTFSYMLEDQNGKYYIVGM